MKKCTSVKQAELLEFFIKLGGKDFGQQNAKNSYCLDMDNLYLAGEKSSTYEASIVIGFEPHPDIISEEKHRGSDKY